MKKYKATANVLGLSPGEIFESDDPFYEPYARKGWLVEVIDDGGRGQDQPGGDEEVAPGGDKESADDSSDQGASGGASKLPRRQRDSAEKH